MELSEIYEKARDSGKKIYRTASLGAGTGLFYLMDAPLSEENSFFNRDELHAATEGFGTAYADVEMSVEDANQEWYDKTPNPDVEPVWKVSRELGELASNLGNPIDEFADINQFLGDVTKETTAPYLASDMTQASGMAAEAVGGVAIVWGATHYGNQIWNKMKKQSKEDYDEKGLTGEIYTSIENRIEDLYRQAKEEKRKVAAGTTGAIIGMEMIKDDVIEYVRESNGFLTLEGYLYNPADFEELALGFHHGYTSGPEEISEADTSKNWYYAAGLAGGEAFSEANEADLNNYIGEIFANQLNYTGIEPATEIATSGLLIGLGIGLGHHTQEESLRENLDDHLQKIENKPITDKSGKKDKS